MKPYLYSLIAAAAVTGLASAQTTAYTTPVGYENVSVATGFNYLSLRLHQPTIAAGTFETVGASSVIDTGANFSALSSNAAQTFIIEIIAADGVMTEVLGSAASGDTITTTDNLSAAGVPNGAAYKIRRASSLSSVFGANNSAGLAAGFGGIGGDIILVPNGSGGFNQFYYDDLVSSWADVNGSPVDGANVPLVYVDTLIISSTGAISSLTVTGEVKTGPTKTAVATGFNYLGSIYPAGATLISTCDAAIPDLDKGFGGIGGDIFMVPNGSGGFNQFYYDDLATSWADVNGSPIDGSTVNLTPGIILSNDGSPMNLKFTQPASYPSE